MKRNAIALFLFALLLVQAAPSFAAEQTPPQENPSQTCANNTVEVEVAPGVFFPLEIPSHGGCTSTAATGELSTAAYIANCKVLKQEMPEIYNLATDIRDNVNYGGFGGRPSTCAAVLRGYHTGTLGHAE